MRNSPYVLVVLDGWGMAPDWGGNAIALAETHCFNYLCQTYPFSTIAASGKDVGLPEHSSGNSEAGHLNLGAGMIVAQDETIINKQIKNGSFFKNEKLIKALKRTTDKKSNLHIMGLLSEAGTHSHINHLFALLKLAKEYNIKNIKIHLFSDGRDSSPMSGIEMVEKVEKEIEIIGVGTIVSVMGRFYAMDRDNRWGRTSRAYNTMVLGEAEYAANARQVFAKSYSHGITDEFIEPRLIVNIQQEASLIKDGDTIILFNFRPDRVKELSMAFVADDIPEFPDRKKLKDIEFLSFTMYEQHYGHWPINHVFAPEHVNEPLAKVFADKGIAQIHIAETEKYAHATYFFDGGNDQPFPLEEWRLIQSPKVKTYDLTPHMSAQEITSEVIKTIEENKHQFIMINYANADMVGHSGNLKATVQAINFTDSCLNLVYNAVMKIGGTLIVCADHGNAEQMVNPQTGQADTEHTTNAVPFIVARADLEKSKQVPLSGRLADVAPTILALADIEVPESMRGSKILLNN